MPRQRRSSVISAAAPLVFEGKHDTICYVCRHDTVAPDEADNVTVLRCSSCTSTVHVECLPEVHAMGSNNFSGTISPLCPHKHDMLGDARRRLHLRRQDIWLLQPSLQFLLVLLFVLVVDAAVLYLALYLPMRHYRLVYHVTLLIPLIFSTMTFVSLKSIPQHVAVSMSLIFRLLVCYFGLYDIHDSVVSFNTMAQLVMITILFIACSPPYGLSFGVALLGAVLLHDLEALGLMTRTNILRAIFACFLMNMALWSLTCIVFAAYVRRTTLQARLIWE